MKYKYRERKKRKEEKECVWEKGREGDGKMSIKETLLTVKCKRKQNLK